MISVPIAVLASLISADHVLKVDPVQGSDLTLEQAVKMSIQANPRLKSVLFEIRAAELGVSSARSLANPVITLTPGFTRSGSDEELLVSQPLEISGTRAARTGVANAELRGARAAAVVELRALVFETKSAYFELARLNERMNLVQELLKGSKELEGIAGRQVELGSRAGIELSQIKIEAARARQQAVLAEAEIKAKSSELNTLMGRANGEPVTTYPLDFQPQAIGEAEAVAQALQFRAELQWVQARKEKIQREASLAKATGLPDIAPQYRAESLTGEPRTGGFGVSISLPFLDYGSRRNQIRQAEAAAKAEEQRLLATQNQIRQEVVQALARLSAAQAVVNEFRSGLLDESRKVLEASSKGFELGETTIVSLLEAQRTFRAVQTEYIDALTSHALARVALERAMGTVPASLLPSLDPKEISR